MPIKPARIANICGAMRSRANDLRGKDALLVASRVAFGWEQRNAAPFGARLSSALALKFEPIDTPSRDILFPNLLCRLDAKRVARGDGFKSLANNGLYRIDAPARPALNGCSATHVKWR